LVRRFYLNPNKGGVMSEKELKEMYIMLQKVVSFIERNSIPVEHYPNEMAFKVPEDVYDEICEDLNIDYISLFGLS
tara:strand:- start:195 stop:422 length:228 start_codon:yes stop_codon:yes gene_type:complete